MLAAADGTVKLVDFGLVKVLQPNDSRTVTVVQGRGTVAYTPLEQYGGDTGFTDNRSDIYALGAPLYHPPCGQPPVDATGRFLRPGALTPSVVLSLGLGVALLVTIVQIDFNLRRQFTAALPDHAPSCLLYTSPSPRDRTRSRMPSSA